MKEQWTHVPGDIWRDRYYVSDMGRVYSAWAGKIMVLRRVVPKDKDRGYRQILFSSGRNGVDSPRTEFARKTWLIHRLVVASFLPNLYSDDAEIHHINGNPSDNRLENLLVITPEEHDILHDEINAARKRAFKTIIDKHRRENGGDQIPLVPLVNPLTLAV